ncbi:MAG: NAD(P)-binding oxidoreductase, partial [Acidobacteriota bacterium]
RLSVRRLIAISSLGVGDSIVNVPFVFRLLMPLFFRGAMPDKAGMESAIASSNLDWLIVRPSGLTNGPLTRNVELITTASGRKARQISRADVAAFILDQITNPTLHQKTVCITST